jgi:hypothetical protein
MLQVILLGLTLFAGYYYGKDVVEAFDAPGAGIKESRARTKAVDAFVPVMGALLAIWTLLLIGHSWWPMIVGVITVLWWSLGVVYVAGPNRATIYYLGDPLRDCGRGLHFMLLLIERPKIVPAPRYRATEEIQAGIEQDLKSKKGGALDPAEIKKRVIDALTTKLLRTRTTRRSETGEVSGLLASYNFEFLYRMVYSVPFALLSAVDQKKMVGMLKNFFEAVCDLVFRGVEYLYIMEAIESDMLWLADPDVLVDHLETCWNAVPQKTPREASKSFMKGHPFWALSEADRAVALAAATPAEQALCAKWRPLPDERLLELFNANNDDAAVDHVFEYYPTSTLARMIADTGFAAVYFRIEDRNEDPAIEEEKNAREVARLRRQTLRLQAQGEGGKLGLKAREVVSASGDACPHRGIEEDKLTDVQRADILRWEQDHKAELAQAREYILKTEMYGATQTVLTDGGGPRPSPVITLTPKAKPGAGTPSATPESED